MKNTKWMTMAAVLTLSTSLAIAAPHEGKGGRGGRHGRGEMGARMFEKLNLTDAQKTQIRTIQENFREANKANFEANKALFEQFREAKKANDTARLDTLKPQVGGRGLVDLSDEDIRKMAKARVEFRQHAATYVLVNLVLAGIWWFSGRSGYYWPIWVHLGWGVGLAFNAYHAYGSGGEAALAREEEKLRAKYGR